MDACRWLTRVERWGAILASLSVRDGDGNDLSPDEGFERWRSDTERLRVERRTVYLIGNGASASMASHVSADLAKNGRLHTQVFSDLSLITAISNDIGYESVFAEPLRRRAEPGDMLVAISSSGRSPNVLQACQVARELGVRVVTLSAMSEDNPLRASGGLNLWVGARDYGDAETCHAAILHQWIDLIAVENGSASQRLASA